ncbi:hypothetical protein MPER_09063 [Moniliophthora perniciosa FA553]|nr:hypothetical protein MPER_09063 [Moniliophthora perniciosa FA553]
MPITMFIQYHRARHTRMVNRADFDKEHIKAPGAAVVCVEPTVLTRSNVTGESLEDSMYTIKSPPTSEARILY